MWTAFDLGIVHCQGLTPLAPAGFAGSDFKNCKRRALCVAAKDLSVICC